jgi:hypothetical protein
MWMGRSAPAVEAGQRFAAEMASSVS